MRRRIVHASAAGVAVVSGGAPGLPHAFGSCARRRRARICGRRPRVRTIILGLLQTHTDFLFLRRCPAYTQTTATTYANYKLVWTPDWLAWMVNSVVMRNETLDVRPGFVPWYVILHARRSSPPRELSFSVFSSQAPGHASPVAAHQLRLVACAHRSLCSRHAVRGPHRVCSCWLDSKHGDRGYACQPRSFGRQHGPSKLNGELQLGGLGKWSLLAL